MALIEQQDVVSLNVDVPSQVPEKVKKYLESYPAVRIVSFQVVRPDALNCWVFLVVETV